MSAVRAGDAALQLAGALESGRSRTPMQSKTRSTSSSMNPRRSAAAPAARPCLLDWPSSASSVARCSSRSRSQSFGSSRQRAVRRRACRTRTNTDAAASRRCTPLADRGSDARARPASRCREIVLVEADDDQVGLIARRRPPAGTRAPGACCSRARRDSTPASRRPAATPSGAARAGTDRSFRRWRRARTSPNRRGRGCETCRRLSRARTRADRETRGC